MKKVIIPSVNVHILYVVFLVVFLVGDRVKMYFTIDCAPDEPFIVELETN